MPHYLILEDEVVFVSDYYESHRKYVEETESAFTFEHVTCVEDAQIALARTRFSGAIIDLKLQDKDGAEGNIVAKKIYTDYFIPIAIVSGFINEADQEFRDLSSREASFLRIYNKNELVESIFEFLMDFEKSGVSRIMGPGGELTTMLSEIFWKHLGGVVKIWEGKFMSTQERRRVLRHAVTHMIGALQSDEDGKWDNFLPEETYIWPAISANVMTGDIYKSKVGKECYLLVTPGCDLVSALGADPLRHFIKLLPFSDFPSKAKIENKIAKKEHRYHFLPATEFFDGGIADFSSLKTMRTSDVIETMQRVGSLIEPYWREMITRLGAWLARQGTPEFNRSDIMGPIEKQWEAAQQAQQGEANSAVALS